MMVRITRRDFLKGSIVVALGAAGATALGACSPSGTTTQKTESKPASPAAPEPAKQESAAATGKVTLHRGYGVAHGEKAFCRAVVATAEDGTILGASIDEFQFLDTTTPDIAGVPNSDKSFGKGYAEGKVLISKSMNGDEGGGYYKHMLEKASAESKPTQSWLASMKAIEAFTAGKKPTDLTDLGVDAVTGATLVDAPNYLKVVAQVAQDNAIVAEGSYTGDGADLKLGFVNEAAHGESAFTDAVALVQGDTVAAASIDDFQFLASDMKDVVSLPDSDKGLGKGYAEGVVLASKSVNNVPYSAMMKEKAQATTPWLESMTAIEAFIAGKKITDVEAAGPDAVSGATLVDTAGYVKAAQDAAKAV